MPNALESGMPPPVQAEQGNGLQPSGPPPGGQPPVAPPPPTHEQVVAALRHFDAIKGGLAEILKDPATGKSDQKEKIIDGMVKLVSERMIPAPQAVVQLAQVPADPLQQRKWLQTMLAQAVQAENAILDHFKQGNPSLGDVAGHVASNTGGSRDDHIGHMAALHANYSGANR